MGTFSYEDKNLANEPFDRRSSTASGPMRSPLTLRTADELAISLDTANVVAAVRTSTGTWAELFRAEAFHGLALVVAISAPDLDAADLVTLGKLGAWICAFDDMVDDGVITDDELALRIAQYELLVCGHACPELAFDPVARTLTEVLDALWCAPLGRSLWPLLTSQLVTSCKAMRWERSATTAQRAGHDTSLDLYLRHRANSICIGLVTTAAAMLIGEPATLACIPAVLTAQRHAATAVRIANDLATWSRKQTEGSPVNALLFTNGAGSDLLQARAESERRSLAFVLGNLHPSIPRTAAFLERLTACMMAIYRRGDLTDVRHDQPA